MSQQSAIEWTDSSWNPVTGCDRVSPGCAHCYALDLAARLKAMGQARYQRDGGKTSGPGFGVTLHPDKLDEPKRWRKPRRVFVNSMSDLFHEAIPFEYIDRVFQTMAVAERHTFQVLTKRPERMRDYFASRRDGLRFSAIWAEPWPLPNVWLGVSIENRRFVHRADLLRETPAAVRFISAEPLLGPLIADSYTLRNHYAYEDQTGDPEEWYWDPGWDDGYEGPGLDLTGIDWLIAGGESGAEHRPVHPTWVRDLERACHMPGPWALPDEDDEQHQTAFFFKQWGGRTPKAGGRLLDGLTWDEFPCQTVVA